MPKTPLVDTSRNPAILTCRAWIRQGVFDRTAESVTTAAKDFYPLAYQKDAFSVRLQPALLGLSGYKGGETINTTFSNKTT
ncbi:MAG: hypothetical protein OXH92_05190 [Bryobacterales bacterium]|nr:hypothetical protein [Bryobacterales bacterium]